MPSPEKHAEQAKTYIPGLLSTGMVYEWEGDECPWPLRKLISDLEDITPASALVLAEQELPALDYFVEPAAEAGRAHAVVYHPERRSHREHFLIAGATQLVRLFSLPRADQVIALPKQPFSLSERLRAEVEESSVPYPENVTCLFCQYTLLQLVESPAQIRVEHELRGRYPSHEHRHEAYLRDRGKCIRSLGDEVPYLPESLASASEAMSVALTYEASRLASIPAPAVNLPAHTLEKSVALRAVLDAVPIEPGYAGDRIVVDAWADILGMSEWYEWRHLPAP